MLSEPLPFTSESPRSLLILARSPCVPVTALSLCTMTQRSRIGTELLLAYCCRGWRAQLAGCRPVYDGGHGDGHIQLDARGWA